MLALVWLLVVDVGTFLVYRIAPILANLILITIGLVASIWFARNWVFASRQPVLLYVFVRALWTAFVAFMAMEVEVCIGVFMACSQIATGVLATIAKYCNIHRHSKNRHAAGCFNRGWERFEHALEPVGRVIEMILPFKYSKY